MNPDLVDRERTADEDRPPEDRNVIEGAALDHLRDGQLLRDGQAYDVTPPVQRDGADAFQWHPDNLRLSLDDLKARYDPELWHEFEEWAQGTDMGTGVTVWDWLAQKPEVGEGRTVAHESIVASAGDFQPEDPNRRLQADDARRSYRGASRLLSGYRPGDDGYSLYGGAPQESAVGAAQIVSASLGVKPLFHEQLSVAEAEHAALVLPNVLLGNPTVAQIEGHLYVFQPEAIARIQELDPAFYRSGGDLVQMIHRKTLAGENGELLGFGVRTMAEESIQVLILRAGRVVAGFISSPAMAEIMASARMGEIASLTGWKDLAVLISPRP